MERAAHAARIMSSSEVLNASSMRLPHISVHRPEAELEQRAAIRGEHHAVVADRELARVQRVDEFRPAVEMDQLRVAVTRVDQPVLDHLPRHADEHQQVLLQQLGTARHVERADDPAAIVEHRRGRTGQLTCSVDRNARAGTRRSVAPGQAGAHAVGAGFAFAPERADAQARGGPTSRERHRGHLCRITPSASTSTTASSGSASC